jgi:hypothetical protein
MICSACGSTAARPSGAFTRFALVVGALVMASLMFGTALRGDWNVLGLQLMYSLAYYVLLVRRSDGVYGVDAWRRSRRGIEGDLLARRFPSG